jgi:hypothetical protein
MPIFFPKTGRPRTAGIGARLEPLVRAPAFAPAFDVGGEELSAPICVAETGNGAGGRVGIANRDALIEVACITAMRSCRRKRSAQRLVVRNRPRALGNFRFDHHPIREL